MGESALSENLLTLQEDETIPYDLLLMFADNPSFIKKYLKKYGHKLYQQCIFSLTHISISEELSELKWKQIVEHREKLNTSLNRDVGLKVAAIDYLENISEQDYKMTTIETDKVNNIVDAATIDKLTSLYVRSIFDEILEKEFQQYLRNNQKLSVMMIDIDDFKNFNDTYGHQEGDEVLKTIGNLLLHTVRKSDIACRYGGEELVVVMPDTNLETATDIAERVRQKIEATEINGKSVTVSIGVSESTESLKMANELLKLADDALYKAKDEGKNQVVKAYES